MTVIDSIINNLRAFFGLPEATEAELDQHLQDQLTQEGPDDVGEEEAEPAGPDAEEETAEEQEERAPEESAEQRILAELEALRQENMALSQQVAALNKKHLAAAAAYEQEQVAADPRERYLCNTTLRAMGRQR